MINLLTKSYQRRQRIINQMIHLLLLAIASIAILFVGIIVLEMVVKGSTPFLPNYTVPGHEYPVNLWNFILGLRWISDHLNFYYELGVGYLVIDTIYIVLLTLCIAVPMALLCALYVVKIASSFFQKIMETVIELLAAIPSIIFGVFGATQLVVLIRNFASVIGITTAGGLSTLSTILTLAIMIMPTVASVLIVSLKAVDPNLEQASLALGASKMQTYFKVVIPAAKSGIMAGIILGVGRALGEATAVAMVSGNANYGPTFGLLSITSTLASKMLVGIKEASGISFDIRFSMGLLLIVILFSSNLFLNLIKKRIRDSK